MRKTDHAICYRRSGAIEVAIEDNVLLFGSLCLNAQDQDDLMTAMVYDLPIASVLFLLELAVQRCAGGRGRTDLFEVQPRAKSL